MIRARVPAGGLAPGVEVGGYRIDAVVDEGGRSSVYAASELKRGGRVALKVFSALAQASDADLRDLSRQTAVDHPHVLPILEVVSTKHGPLVILPLVEGPSLARVLSDGPVEPRRALRILLPVAGALDAAHRAGIVHGNVRPRKLLVEPGDVAYLTHFGLLPDALQGGDTGSRYQEGTPGYLSPEQIQRDPATTESDVYALGCVLFECVTGSLPFAADWQFEVLAGHLYRQPPRPSALQPELPAAMDDVLLSALAKRPEERPRSATELLHEAERALIGRSPRHRGGARASHAPTRSKATGGGAVAAQPTRPPEPAPARREPAPAPPEPAATPPQPAMPAEPAIARSRPAPTPAEPTEASHATSASSPAPTSERARASRGSRERRGGGRALLGVGALVLVAGAAGLLAGSGSRGSDAPAREPVPPPAPRRERAGDLAVTVPGTWERVRPTPRIPGLRLEDARAFAPRGRRDVALVLGQATSADPSLLPPRFLARLDERPTQDDAVRLGRAQAYRYRDLTPRGLEGRATLYVAPTTGGMATAACIAPATQADRFGSECERVVGTLGLSGVDPYPVGPDREYAAVLNTTLRRLNVARTARRARLGRARRPAGQADAANDLARAYGAAAGALDGRRGLSPPARALNQRIVLALLNARDAYAALGISAASGNRPGFVAAKQAVRQREAELQDGLRQLEALGYRSAESAARSGS